ncbi:MAG: hypothetical protein KKG59_06520, partial [Nanoarchaeota archaeon]|nr:hypothetical protein [Nanoarchaeota archaeon]
MALINLDQMLIDQFKEKIVIGFDRYQDPRELMLRATAESIGNLISAKADTLYHDLFHTVRVTLTMSEILRGKATVEPVSADDWFNSIMAGIHHDVGLLRNLFNDDNHELGSTGASLYPVHVERSMKFVMERYVNAFNIKAVADLIEYTQFPVPSGLDDHGSYGGLLRAADYIGQFTDPNLRRMNVNLLS